MSGAATDEIRALIGRGELLMAADLGDAAIGDDPAGAPLELVWLTGLALARCGATDRAEQLLTAADVATRAASAEPALRDDLAGLRARLIKDRAIATTGPERAALAAAAADAYAGDDAGTYRLVNEATMRLLAGDRSAAEAAAGRALALLPPADDGDYWTHATRAELSLLLGRLDDTEAALRAAAATDPDWSMRSSTIRQLRFVCAELDVDPSVLDALPLPTVAHYSGHMFAAGPVDDLRDQIRTALVEHGVGSVHGSLACGSDTLIVETALELGLEVHIVIPCPLPEFLDRSVRPGGHDWVERFERALEAATSVVIEPTIALEDEAMFAYADQLAMGFALARARQQDAHVFQLAVWDGVDLGGEAGTGAAVRRWRATGNETAVVSIDRSTFEPVGESAAPPDTGDRPRSVKALLFADVKGFSGLSERDLPDFFEEVMAGLAAVIDRYGDAVHYRNTWGDAVYLVVETAGVAADLALAMQSELRSIAERIGRPALSARIGGHAGPVYVGHDHINDEPTFYGTHVTRAARIEPRTPPGEVYVTEHFAALVSLERVDAVRLEYVGHIPTAKDYGAFPMYVLRR